MKCEKCGEDSKKSEIYLLKICEAVSEFGHSYELTGTERICFCSNGHIFMDFPSRKQKFIFAWPEAK